MNLVFLSYICILITLFGSCRSEEKSDVIVKVFDEKLYREDLDKIMPKGVKLEDSLLIAHNYIRDWITNQLLVSKALNQLSEEEKDIEDKVCDYRTSLLVHRYKQKIIRENFDKKIEDKDVLEYFNKYKSSFLLQNNIAKAMFFVIPDYVKNIDEIKKLYKSNKEKDLLKLKDICIKVALKYDDFSGGWIEIDKLSALMPGNSRANFDKIINRRSIYLTLGTNYYFLKVISVKKINTATPFEYVKDDIRLILENKKKVEYEKDLERVVNEEAVKNNYVKYY